MLRSATDIGLDSQSSPLPHHNSKKLNSIPGSTHLALFRHTIPYILDSQKFILDYTKKYGTVFKTKSFGSLFVNFSEPEAAELILKDTGQKFSSTHGWAPFLQEFFSGGLMLRDFGDHKDHRSIMQKLFRPKRLIGYLQLINEVVIEEINKWGQQKQSKIYWDIKDLTLKIAAKAFLGIQLESESRFISQCFTDMLAAALVLIRKDLPGTKFRQGIRGKKFLYRYLQEQIPLRRNSDSQDMFTYLCKFEHDSGGHLSENEILDHMNFLLMAAHDTVTSSLSTSLYYLSHHQKWQERLREETCNIAKNFSFADLANLRLYDYVLYESLRLYPPVFYIPRLALEEFYYKDFVIPKNTLVSVVSYNIHRLEKYWNDPLTFNPLRFSPEVEEHKKHPFMYLPFGGGSHRCLGMAFASLVAKSVLHNLFQNYETKLCSDTGLKSVLIPIPRPKDGLPLLLNRI